MKHLNDFKNIIVYDFDGTLHLTVDSFGNPLDFTMDVALLKPNWAMIKKLKEDAKDHRIIIVSARNYGDEAYINAFVKLHKLPVEDVFCTNDRPKLPFLQDLGAIKIYDDNPRVERNVAGSGIIFSYPIYDVSSI